MVYISEDVISPHPLTQRAVIIRAKGSCFHVASAFPAGTHMQPFTILTDRQPLLVKRSGCFFVIRYLLLIGQDLLQGCLVSHLPDQTADTERFS